MVAKDASDSSDSEEVSNFCGGASGGNVVKKGPWTADEDAILTEYVRNHGEGNWNAVQKNSGLSRCGKSCRFRWINHLRPNLKKGAFSPEEEQLVIDLHAQMGNKWARMAAFLPGRTDNEIKNYWNTRLKRRRRAGLALYPPEVTMKTMGESQQGMTMGGHHNAENGHQGFFQPSNFEIPDIMLDMKVNPDMLPHSPDFPDIAPKSILTRSMASPPQNGDLTLPTMHQRQKRMRDSRTLLPDFFVVTKSMDPMFHPFQDTSDKASESFVLPFPFDPDQNIKEPEPFDGSKGSHVLSAGNFSTSMPISKAVKSELPSFQYKESVSNWWGTSSSPPSLLDSVDSCIQSPLTDAVESRCKSPNNSGLLDALVRQENALSSTKNQMYYKGSYSPTFNPSHTGGGSTKDIDDTGRDGIGHPLPPLGHTTPLLFGDCTPIIGSGICLDGQAVHETFSSGCDTEVEPFGLDSKPSREEERITKFDSSFPDKSLATYWDSLCSNFVKNHGVLTEAVAAILGEDLSSEYVSR